MIAYEDALYNGITSTIHNMFSTHRDRMKEYEGTLMLSHAISRNAVELVRFLLNAEADLCSADDAGCSQIELAAFCGTLEVFKILYDTKNTLAGQLKRVIHACIQSADETGEKILEELVGKKITVHETDLDMNGWSVKDCAVYAGNLQILTRWPHLLGAPPASGEAAQSTMISQQIPPSAWAVSKNNPFLDAKGCILEITSPFPERLRDNRIFTRLSRTLVRADHCIPSGQRQYYWELRVLDHSGNESISIGLRCPNSDFHCHAGWSKSSSIRYHSDDGGIFLDSGGLVKEGLVWDKGDVVGCLVEVNDTVRTVQFFRSGHRMTPALQLPDKLRGQLYPCVGLDASQGTEGTRVQATFAAEFAPLDGIQSTINDKTVIAKQLQKLREEDRWRDDEHNGFSLFN